jgi:hypothetical protein
MQNFHNYNMSRITLATIATALLILVVLYKGNGQADMSSPLRSSHDCEMKSIDSERGFGDNKPTREKVSRIHNLPRRENFSHILNEFGMSTMIELGVAQGQFADILLVNWNPSVFKHYYGIDAWGLKRKDGLGFFPDYYELVSKRLNSKYGKLLSIGLKFVYALQQAFEMI